MRTNRLEIAVFILTSLAQPHYQTRRFLPGSARPESGGAAGLATTVRDLSPALDAAVEKARTAISTETLLVDDEDRRLGRRRRIQEAGVARQLDLLGKVRAVAQPAASALRRSSP